MAERLWILGGGGHAKVVISTARAAGFVDLAVADDAPDRLGTELLGVRVEATLQETLLRDVSAVLAVGDNRARHDLASRAMCRFATIVHPSCVRDPSVGIGAGSVVFASTVLQPDTQLGPHAIVNTGASIDHDCVLGIAVHVAPGARLAGNVTLGAGVFVGIGAVIIPGRQVGAWTRIGAGAAVVHDLPPGVTAVGVPARSR